MKWLELVRDRFSAAYCEKLQYLSDCNILKKDPALSSFVSTDSFFTSLHICTSSHCVLTINLVNTISPHNHFRFLHYVGYENKCQQLWGWWRSKLSINCLLLHGFPSRQAKAHNASKYYQLVITPNSSNQVIARKLDRIARTRTAARSVRAHWSLVRSLCCRSVLGLSVVQKISDDVICVCSCRRTTERTYLK